MCCVQTNPTTPPVRSNLQSPIFPPIPRSGMGADDGKKNGEAPSSCFSLADRRLALFFFLLFSSLSLAHAHAHPTGRLRKTSCNLLKLGLTMLGCHRDYRDHQEFPCLLPQCKKPGNVSHSHILSPKLLRHGTNTGHRAPDAKDQHRHHAVTANEYWLLPSRFPRD